MSRHIDDVAVDRSASYQKKYFLSRLKYLWRCIFGKYIDAERLKAEIERLGRNWDGVQELQPASLFQADLYELLSIIDSLQQEQPQVADASKMEPEVDLEKEIKRYQEHYILVRDIGFSLNWMDIETTARHFYELGLNAKKED